MRIKMIRMGGNANVAKNAVAAAIRKGSFAFSSTKDRRSNVPKPLTRVKNGIEVEGGSGNDCVFSTMIR